ncbi:MAG: O-antigen ligase family protein [Pseudomonadales bacterium]
MLAGLFTLILLHAPPINTKYGSLAFTFGSINVHLMDFLLIAFVAGTIKLAFFSSRSLMNALSGVTWIAVVIFLMWHFFRAVFQITGGETDLQLILRLFSARCFAVLVIFVPFFLKSGLHMNGRDQITIALFAIGLLPVFGFANYLLSPEGLMLTSSGTKRYLIGTANIFLGLGLVIALAAHRARWYPAYVAVPYILWMVIGMALTQHRSAFVAFISVILIDTIFCAKKNQKLVRITALLVISPLALFLGPSGVPESDNLLGETITRVSDTFSTENSTTLGRLDKWDERLEIVKENPWTGSGYGRESVKERSRSLVDRQAGHEAHNFLVSILTYEGIIGLAINLALMCTVMWQAWKLLIYSKSSGLEIPFLFIVYFVVYSLFNTTYFNPITAPVYFCALGVTAYLRRTQLIARRASLRSLALVPRDNKFATR